MPPAQTELMLFEVERSAGVDGREVVKAKRVVRPCSVKDAAKMLEVSERTVRRNYHAGLIGGWQPGLALAAKRAACKGAAATNVKIVLDWESVAKFRESERASQNLKRDFLG